ncbi:hypothetical protein BH18ACT1_BH18ACT1_15930 [soil metagenome]
MSGPLFLLGAVTLSLLGSLALWLRTRQPSSFESGIDDFARRRALLAPERLAGKGRADGGLAATVRRWFRALLDQRPG